MRKSLYWITAELFAADILVVNCPREKYSKIVGRLGIDDSPNDNNAAHCSFVSKMDGQGFWLIWVSSPVYSLNWYIQVAHELSHLVDCILDTRSIPPGKESTETRAYLTDHLFEQILCMGKRSKQNSPEKRWKIKI